MNKFTDKTMDEWDDLIELWHNSTNIEETLQEFLGLDDMEYLKMMHQITDDTLTYEEVIDISRSICLDVVQTYSTPVFSTYVILKE